MKIEYTGRSINITPALKAHVKEKLDHALRALADVVGAHAILAVEKYRHIVEIVVARRRGTLSGRASSADMYQSVQTAIDRIEKQVRRKREKQITRKRRGAAEKASAAATAEVEILEREESMPRIIEEPADRVKPISVEEAILLLESARRPFVAFRSSSEGRVGVVYRRPDGNFGYVDLKG